MFYVLWNLASSDIFAVVRLISVERGDDGEIARKTVERQGRIYMLDRRARTAIAV